MKNFTDSRPKPNEYNSFYKGYIDQVKDDDFYQALSDALTSIVAFYKNIPAGKWEHRYAPDKWTIKELLLHIIDAERIFACRALRIARNDMTPLPAFDESKYTPASKANLRTPGSLIEEYIAVRESTLHLFKYMDDEAIGQIGTASDSPASPRALGFIIAGHELHHVNIIKERYLLQTP